MNGISTEAIADLYWAGEDVEDEYGLDRHELLRALWFEGRRASPGSGADGRRGRSRLAMHCGRHPRWT
jgi:hypothetical protein